LKEITRKKLLAVVKAYPNPSTKYGETVCCVGIDLTTFKLIRLYPIPFRDLDNDRKFKKYSVIEVDCFRPSDDKRPESFCVNPDSIKVLSFIDTEKGTWNSRKDIVLKVPVKSMCQIYEEYENSDTSLGLIKPEKVSFSCAKQSLSKSEAREICYAQLSFLDKAKDAIEEIPFHFYYSFKCAGIGNCPGHKLSIIDWEIGQAYRDWRARYS